MSARFGPAGNAADFPYKTSAQAPGWLRELGLDCYEYQCGKGVHVGEDTARRIGAAAREHGIPLKTIHITDRETAQNAPAPVTTYALFCDGKFVTHAIQSDKKFLSLAGVQV